MDNETTTPKSEDESFAKEVAKSAVISAVATAGSVIGLVAVAFVINKFTRKDKAADTETTPVTPDAE